MDTRHFLYHFPFFKGREQALDLAEFQDLQLKDSQTLFTPGNSCTALPFVFSGLIRVYLESEEGRELTLYTIGPGESCIISTSCIMEGTQLPATAKVIEPGQGFMIPAQKVKALGDKSPDWREFIFSLYGQRLTSLISLVSAVSFQKLDQRLWAFLKQRQEFGKIPLTHGEIALELGTSREVVSRLLKDWEIQGRIESTRGLIRLL